MENYDKTICVIIYIPRFIKPSLEFELLFMIYCNNNK